MTTNISTSIASYLDRLSIAHKINSNNVRSYIDDSGNPMASVFDVIQAMGMENPHKVYARLCKSSPYIDEECTFVFNTKEDARVIESALAGVFSHITLFGSREYLCVKSLAEFLDVPDYDPQSYDAYLSMAKNLFRYAVRLTCTMWTKRYNNTAKRLSVDKVEEDFKIDI